MSSVSTSQPPAPSEAESTTANGIATPHDPGSDSAGPARSRLSLQLDQRSLHFSVNAWVNVVNGHAFFVSSYCITWNFV